ncbi:molecular chaperone [Bifidobacterium lemurum]|uniref:Molecular chaperone n=1 Tax=Bifidobacterium lemurum TaxID=1603886 RepID=A0A261FJC1_9BIFI|nr:hypothetical protein [Bifidobacterium lemurum]OZG59261.1 molecular chaperone [Bifidobacterium lemurum]QOL33908.1 hypothetical protein BL8807_09085 [Bifidobacterium lemurum]
MFSNGDMDDEWTNGPVAPTPRGTVGVEPSVVPDPDVDAGREPSGVDGSDVGDEWDMPPMVARAGALEGPDGVSLRPALDVITDRRGEDFAVRVAVQAERLRGEYRRSEPSDGASPAVDAADMLDDLAAVSDVQPDPASPDPPRTGIPAKRDFRGVRIVLAVAVGILAVAIAAGATLAVLHARADKTALEKCSSAYDAAKSSLSELTGAIAEAEELLDGIGEDDVLDAATISDLETLTATESGAATTCPADAGADALEAAATANRTSADRTETLASRVEQAMSDVRESMLDKTVAIAEALLESSDGKVQDDKTRDKLREAIEERDADAIAKAVKAVNESINAKTEADRKAQEEADRKAAEEAEAAAQAQSQSAPQQQQSYTPSYSYGGNAGSDGGTSSGSGSSGTGSSSGSDGWYVPEPMTPNPFPDVIP